MTMTKAIDTALGAITFNDKGLVPAIAQEVGTGAVLMMAWMNEEAVRETLETGRVTYFSRSRQSLWRKGETSGHTQELVDFRIDCDGDTILCLVHQTGAACHTGERTCFFQSVGESELESIPSENQEPK